MSRVLVIEPSKATAKFIQATLLKAGFECDLACTYDGAQQLIAANEYFVGLSSMLLDDAEYGMGIDLLLENSIPAIAVTSSLDEQALGALAEKSIVDYVLKKSDQAEYISRIVSRVYKNQGIKVLVVDDSTSVRDWISRILMRQGLTVLQAEDGRAATKVFYKNNDIKLVLTDYYMPEMDGLELTAHLRSIRSMEELSIVVLSSDSKSRTAPLFLKQGANDFIQKTASVEEILCRVNSNLEFIELIQASRDRANKDYLTGLWNRRYFFEYGTPIYEQGMTAGNELCVVMLDIDHFKKINDTYGHDAGDEVLKDFSSLLADYIGDVGLVSRFGGEEFTVLLNGIQADELFDFLEDFREEVGSFSVDFKGQVITLTVSIGATANMDESLTVMVSRADDKLYEAKRTGRNKVLCDW
ncbi:diguanylate cyclase [Maridesulfovibrio salexigens]|uniref:diguanylate cyclase n=1 Tax=Maridesulfovibrio salexigens (strain ATCC 14822 / DSM 2638 / NCIMB 8403 / VKM B-1763) TaxID=526222 RepID=C6BRW0_MARSD|nr:diguanylate cyclase [Maridesulfovibrio salexigens]ACS81343.1 response regulator receiver modulated diguanylate cyclase [Maridesulfovibrio salexigens DSM 2638]